MGLLRQVGSRKRGKDLRFVSLQGVWDGGRFGPRTLLEEGAGAGEVVRPGLVSRGDRDQVQIVATGAFRDDGQLFSVRVPGREIVSLGVIRHAFQSAAIHVHDVHLEVSIPAAGKGNPFTIG